MDGIQIVLLIIIVLALIAIYYSSTYNKIKTEILKINSSESEIDTLLRNKYDLIAKVNTIIKYYNDSISGYNALVSKFPTKLIAIITRLKEKRYFDGKNMYDDNYKDFKI